jgi:hypothetical protein
MARARVALQQEEVRRLEVELAQLAGRMVAADTIVNLNDDGPDLVNGAAAVMQAMGHLVDQASGTDPPVTDLGTPLNRRRPPTRCSLCATPPET